MFLELESDKLLFRTEIIKKDHLKLDDRKLSIIVLSLFSGWLLSLLIEGKILYSLAEKYQIEPFVYIISALIANYIGLLVAGLFVKSQADAKKLLLVSFVVCFVLSIIFFFPPSWMWYAGIIIPSFLAGACVSGWSYFLQSGTAKNERIKTVADLLILSNIFMIGIELITTFVSIKVGLVFSMGLLVLAFLFGLKLSSETKVNEEAMDSEQSKQLGVRTLTFFLGFFIFFLTITSGMMYHVVKPAFVNIEWITSWYWAIPYIISIFIMRNLPKRISRAYLLFVAISKVALSFIGFMVLDRGAVSFFVINTLMLGASGVFDLFLWSILGEMIDLHKNPPFIFGVGISANVLGLIIGGLLSREAIHSKLNLPESPYLALILISITLILLPPLHKHLVGLLKNHAYLVSYSRLSEQDKVIEIDRTATYGHLTERESQVVARLLEGKTLKVIASELFISENTVKYYVKGIYGKFNVHNRTELITLLYERKEEIGLEEAI